MQRKAVESSNIAEIGYHQESATLEILFRTGRMYQYFDVPLKVYQGLVHADSCGRYLNREIKGQYRYARV